MRALKTGAFGLLGGLVSLPYWYLLLMGSSLLIPESQGQERGALFTAGVWASQILPPLIVAAFALTRVGRAGRPFLFGLAAGLATIGTLFLLSMRS